MLTSAIGDASLAQGWRGLLTAILDYFPSFSVVIASVSVSPRNDGLNDDPSLFHPYHLRILSGGGEVGGIGARQERLHA